MKLNHLKVALMTMTLVVLFTACNDKPDNEETAKDVEMVKVEGGTFTMGCTPEQGKDFNGFAKPTHQVTLSDFSISKTEITQEQYVSFLNACKIAPITMSESGRVCIYYNGNILVWLYSFPAPEYVNDHWQVKAGYENYPINVTWYGADEYCKWAGGHLSTEAEWEYAARGGNKSKGYKYAGSDSLNLVAWSSAHEVGKKQPNELGLYDMSGNAEEWCYDWFGRYTSEPQTNPTGPTAGSRRVKRFGTSLSVIPYSYGVSCRNSFPPDFNVSYIGFRLVRSSK